MVTGRLRLVFVVVAAFAAIALGSVASDVSSGKELGTRHVASGATGDNQWEWCGC